MSASSSPPTAATPPRKLYHSKSTNLPVDNNNEIGKSLRFFFLRFIQNNIVITVLIYCVLLESSKIRPILNNSETSSSQRCYSGSNSSIQNVDKKSPSPIVDMKVPLYSNIKYSFAQNHSPMLPLDQYIREQAVLSGMVCVHFS